MKSVRHGVIAFALAIAIPLPAVAAEGFGFRYDDETIRSEELPVRLRQEMFELELETNEQRRDILDRFVVKRYIDEMSVREGRPTNEIREELLAVPPANDTEIRTFYDANKQRIGRPLDQIRSEIVNYLGEQRERARMDGLIERIREEKGYERYLPLPQQPRFDLVTEGYPSKGSADATVTVVEFADFQCEHCKAATTTVRRLLQEFGNDIRVVYRDFPVNSSGISRVVAMGAYCANQQGRFWEYHDLAFEMQDYLRDDSPQALGADIKLERKDFEACLASGAAEDAVQASYAEAIGLGVSGTPTFFVNGRKLHVHGDLDGPLFDAVRTALNGDR
ncbi:MAG: DsbA family protein [Alphaproteobacteria bacterium]